MKPQREGEGIDVKALREALATMPRLVASGQNVAVDVVGDPLMPRPLYLVAGNHNAHVARGVAERVVTVLNAAPALLDRIEALEAGLREALDAFEHRRHADRLRALSVKKGES